MQQLIAINLPARAFRRLAAVFLFLGLAFPVLAGELPSAQPPFSADSRFEGGGMVMEGKVWHLDGKRRQEMTFQGANQVMILRPDLGVMYMIMAGTGMAMEMPLSPGMASMGYDNVRALQPRAVGEETVSGLATTKYRIDHSEPDGSMTGHSWITDDGIMVKMEGEVSAEGQVEPIGFLLTNIQRGDQNPSLFELPAGLQVMKMPAMPTQ